MPIVALSDSFLPTKLRDVQVHQDSSKVSDRATHIREWEKQNRELLDSLREQAEQHGVEVRLHVMPQSNRIVIRFMESSTGQMIREFPSEDLVLMLQELQQSLQEKNNEPPLVDQLV